MSLTDSVIYALHRAINHVSTQKVETNLVQVVDMESVVDLEIVSQNPGFQLQRYFNVAQKLIASNDRLSVDVREASFEMRNTKTENGWSRILIRAVF